jgi:hypothetical protein
MHLDPVPPLLQLESRQGEQYGQHFIWPLLRKSGGPRACLGIHLFRDSDAWELSESDMQRLVCHAMIQCLDDRGLREAVDSLSDMVRFYQNPPPPYLVVPEGPSVPVKMGPPEVRPVFPVTEED